MLLCPYCTLDTKRFLAQDLICIVSSRLTLQLLPLQVFYAACQGLLYVLCYRLEQLMVSKTGGLSDGVRALFKDVLPALLHHR